MHIKTRIMKLPTCL